MPINHIKIHKKIVEKIRIKQKLKIKMEELRQIIKRRELHEEYCRKVEQLKKAKWYYKILNFFKLL